MSSFTYSLITYPELYEKPDFSNISSGSRLQVHLKHLTTMVDVKRGLGRNYAL